MKGYDPHRLYQELTFLAYYLGWDYTTLLQLEHRDRIRFCEGVSQINEKINGDEGRPERSLEEFY